MHGNTEPNHFAPGKAEKEAHSQGSFHCLIFDYGHEIMPLTPWHVYRLRHWKVR